jgi:hypothetical protein
MISTLTESGSMVASTLLPFIRTGVVTGFISSPPETEFKYLLLSDLRV